MSGCQVTSWWLSGKESACSTGDAGDLGLIPWLGGSLALSIFQLLVAAGYWVDGLTTGNLMKSTEKNHTVEIMLSSHDFHA